MQPSEEELFEAPKERSRAHHNIYYVYFLRSINFPDQTYIGCTHNLKEHLNKHNSGGSDYTVDHKPWEIIAYICFTNKTKALEFEKLE